MVFVVLPLAAVWLVDPLLFSVFGDGRFIAADAPGYGVVDWWSRTTSPMLTVGVVALALLLLRRVFPPLALALATAAGVVTLPWAILSLLVALLVSGSSLN